MKLYAYRWENGDTSIVYARDELDAFNRLDEFGNVAGIRPKPEGGYTIDEFGSIDLKRLIRLDSCMIDLRLADNGDLELQALGEEFSGELNDWAYPELMKVWSESDEEDPEYGNKVREAVRKERDTDEP